MKLLELTMEEALTVSGGGGLEIEICFGPCFKFGISTSEGAYGGYSGFGIGIGPATVKLVDENDLKSFREEAKKLEVGIPRGHGGTNDPDLVGLSSPSVLY
ncbi:hypothetical protein [Calidithermus roseus]|uniref:hypothetical protein n=1 Tax=Calidithermus roseus TaxID=1644118 RepID=UPI0011C4796D|nr:hypothetical protein [Calidithermus roseus]